MKTRIWICVCFLFRMQYCTFFNWNIGLSCPAIHSAERKTRPVGLPTRIPEIKKKKKKKELLLQFEGNINSVEGIFLILVKDAKSARWSNDAKTGLAYPAMIRDMLENHARASL